MTDQISPHVLTMPLAELRERTELAERLAIASRHANLMTSAAPGAAAAPATGTTKQAPAAAAVKPAATAAKPAAAKPAATPAPAAAAPAADDTDAAFGDADDFGGGGDDMLDGFVEDLTPEQARAAATVIAKGVIDAKNADELKVARDIMAKYGVKKVSEIAEDKSVEAYEAFKEAFPQHIPA